MCFLVRFIMVVSTTSKTNITAKGVEDHFQIINSGDGGDTISCDRGGIIILGFGEPKKLKLKIKIGVGVGVGEGR